MVELYEIAEENNIEIFCGNIPETKSMAVPGAICLDAGLVYSGAEERTHCAHELGHCIKGAFYTRDDPPYIKQRMENRADKWAIKKLVPKDELEQAVKHGYTEIWQLAEYFDVMEELMVKAVCWYQHGNLALKYYQ